MFRWEQQCGRSWNDSAEFRPAGRGDDLSAFRGRLRPRRLVHEGVNSDPTYKFLDLATYRFFSGSSSTSSIYRWSKGIASTSRTTR